MGDEGGELLKNGDELMDLTLGDGGRGGTWFSYSRSLESSMDFVLNLHSTKTSYLTRLST
jgi:hypothetical protein